MKLNLIIFVFAALLLQTSVSLGAINQAHSHTMTTVQVTAKGEYQNIDNQKSLAAITVLKLDDKVKVGNFANSMLKNLGNYDPAALMQLAIFLKDQKRFDDAFKIYYLAKLRMMVDIRASNDPTTGDIYMILSSAFYSLSPFQEPDSTGKQLRRDAVQYFAKHVQDIISLDKNTPRNYEMRWPSLHGMGAFMGKPLNYAKGAELEKIIATTRADFIQMARDSNQKE